MIKLRKLLKSESGATAIEYGLIAAFVALAIFVGAQMAGNGLNKMFTVIGTKMSSAASTAQTQNSN
ncbi:Flp family type IVb pilin [Dongia sp.]|jgi:pilus assembly protein Flp/PilA|uniref:Flp family type IVb pilin n=1 Tax=Dongia sp. TaxID=1977262 RepID=UPI0035B119B3